MKLIGTKCRRQSYASFKVLKEHNLEPNILQSIKLSINGEGKIKILNAKAKLIFPKQKYLNKKLGVKHGLCKLSALLAKKFEKEKQNY